MKGIKEAIVTFVTLGKESGVGQGEVENVKYNLESFLFHLLFFFFASSKQSK